MPSASSKEAGNYRTPRHWRGPGVLGLVPGSQVPKCPSVAWLRFAFPKPKVLLRKCGMKNLKIIIEKYSDGYVAYPVGIKGVVVGEGDSYEEALRDIKSALKFHLESFGPQSLDTENR
jgi:predicted RNase H-like HicB family nuclease